MAYPKEIKELGEPWTSVYSLKDPMEFIDMLAANNYISGQFDNKMPVAETRTVFLTWLANFKPKPSKPLKDKEVVWVTIPLRHV
jgi:hypothetical protein